MNTEYTVKLDEVRNVVTVFDKNNTGIEVSFHHDYDDKHRLIYQTFHGEKQISYRLVSYPGSPLADWKGFERACQIVGRSNIDNAHELLDWLVYVRIPALIEVGKTHPAYEMLLSEILSDSKMLQYFKTDFYHHDTLQLGLWLESHNNNADNFIWMVRKSGTRLVPYANVDSEWNQAVIDLEIKERQHKIYYWHNGKLYRVFKVSDLKMPSCFWRLESLN